MNPIKLIFLDIDGVLNTHWSMSYCLCLAHHLHHFQKSCVRELNRLVKLSGAKVVVSSTWRKHKDWYETLEHIAAEGVRCDIIGRTPALESRIRGHEIQEWLRTYPYRAHVSSFVILDDDSDMAWLHRRLVQTSMDGGLRRHHVDQALKILKMKWTPSR